MTVWLVPVLLVGLASGARVFSQTNIRRTYGGHATIIGYHSLASRFHPTLAQEGGWEGEGPCCAPLFPPLSYGYGHI
ncbi:hypothetical protein DFP73DRAFT_534721 [Morchella snyderi]|nr:hypothetical protein DFP73DRAFT_534721 [Morchella snyderi]